MSSPVTAHVALANLSAADAATCSCDTGLAQLGTRPDGLTAAEVARQRALLRLNVIAVRRVRAWEVFARQLRSALPLLLVV